MEFISFRRIYGDKRQTKITIPKEIVDKLNLRKIKNIKIFVEDWTDDSTGKESKCLVILPLEEEE